MPVHTQHFKSFQCILCIVVFILYSIPVFANYDTTLVKEEFSKPVITHVFVDGSALSRGSIGKQMLLKLDHMNFPKAWKDKELILYVNRRPYASIQPIHINVDNNELRFTLAEELEEGQKGKLLSHLYELGQDEYNIHLSIGTSDGDYAELQDGKSSNFTLILYNQWILYAGLALIFIVVAVFLYLCKSTRIIRDDSIIQEHAPYSLARTQLAWWTLIIFSALVFIICITWNVNPLNSSVVILLGISAGTTAAGRLIDKKEQSDQGTPDNHLLRIQDTKSEGFFSDILSDGVHGGISIHRFQNVIFNLALGLHFIYTVITTLEMPVYDTEILSLIGISSLTYAGLKTYENKNNTSLKEA